MIGKKVTKQSLVPIWEKKNIEQYYSRMAEDGYFVSDKSMLYEEFVQGVGEKRRYVVVLHKNLSNEEMEELKQSGWEKGFWYDACLVLSTKQEDSSLPFEDDIEDWSNHLLQLEAENKVLGFGVSMVILLVVLSFGYKIGMLNGFLLWILGVLMLWAYKCFMKYHRAKKVRQDIFWGKKDNCDWLGVKRANQFYWVVFFLYILALILFYI